MKALALKTLEAIWMAVAVSLVMGLLTYAGAWAWLNHTETGQEIKQTIQVINEIDLTIVTEIANQVEIITTTNGGLVGYLEKWDKYLDSLQVTPTPPPET